MQIAVRVLKGTDKDCVKVMTDLRMPGSGFFSDIAAGVILSVPEEKKAVRLLTRKQTENYKTASDFIILSSNECNCIDAPRDLADVFPMRSILLIVNAGGNRYLCASDEALIALLENDTGGGI